MITRHYTTIKSVLRKQQLADFFTISKYGFSPYRACEHGCLYCDGRAEKYYVDGVFDKDIVIRKNIPDLLEKELLKIREQGFLCIGSGVSDPYQPVESEERIMRKCAEILLRFSLPVVVMTKSSLVLRDLDLWAEVNRKSKFLLMVSLTFSDDTMRLKFEPGASSVQNRLRTLDAFKKAGCSTGVLAMPFLPYITETSENMHSIASLVKDVNADFCMPGGLTLRPGIQKETFFNCLQLHCSQYMEEYRRIYTENRASGAPSAFWTQRTAPLYQDMIKTSGLPNEIPHTIYRNRVPIYEEVYLILCQMKFSYENKCVNTRRLQSAIIKYYEWVIEQKKPINRSRKRSFDEIDETLKIMCETGKISAIVKNEKLGDFIWKIVVNRAVFDSITCELKCS